ncbi:hypothetical protein FRB90_011502 [Tulasnella sp. 427]|nr:hypothetical protein FRB90_011502 [Tulasnella sp. 427]
MRPLSQRAPSRHAQRFGPQLRKLVENVTGLSPEDDDEDYEDACDLALRTLETNRYTGLRVNLEEVEARIDGLIEKAQIKGQDVMATALLETRNRLRSTVKEVSETTDDPLIRDSLLPDHIHFLLLLANASTSVTQATAADILHSMRNPPSPPHVLTWEEILAEEPFEGEHWRMPPSPSSSSLSSWSDLPSKPQLMDPQDSSSSSAIEEAPSEKSQELAAVNEGANDAANEDSQITIDDLKQQLYWTDLPPLHDAPFDIGVPSTLGPALASLQRSTSSPPVHISEVNAVREALMALQGCYGYVFQLDSESRQVQIAPSAPVLSHMSPGTFRSLLSAFAETSTTLAHLRHFVDATGRNALAQGPNYRCRTLSAFSEGIEVLLNDFGTWCGEIEMQVCAAEAGSGPEIVVSLLSLRNKLEQETNATFDILWLIARKFCSTSGGSSSRDLRLFDPCSTTQSILDHLLAYSHSHASMGDDKTAASLVKVFTYALTPLWSSLHLWLKDGVPATSALDAAFGSTGGIIHDSEFFIEITDGLLTSPDSWNDACAIRSTMDSGNEGVPECFRAIGSQLLSAGKAVGLLRALGTEDFFYNSGGPGTEHEWLADWVKARVLFDDQLLDGDSAQLDADEIEHHSSTTIDSEQHSALRHSEIRIEDVSARIAQYLLPRCWLAQARLNEVVFDDSRLWDHLRVVEDVYLMRRGDVMADFCDIVYSRMDAGLPWSDFHFLNGAFRDSLEASGCSWINPALMRISYQAATNVSVNPTIAAFGGLTLDYQAPFPLNYMLSPSTKRLYCQVFVLLLQLRRCKAILQKMNFDYAKLPDLDLTGETLRAFYGLKAKLVWFIK